MAHKILIGDCRSALRDVADRSIQTAISSPPYWGLRDYAHPDQIGLEPEPQQYVEHICEAMREVNRCLRDDGTLWLNLGDSYAGNGRHGKVSSKSTLRDSDRWNPGGAIHGHRVVGRAPTPAGYKQKDLIGIPWMVANALRAEGWYLRSEIIWHKKNPMPESVVDRPSRAHETIFLLSKGKRYFYDGDAIREPLAEGSILRLSQSNLLNQRGALVSNGGAKLNGPMKPVYRSGNTKRSQRSDAGGAPNHGGHQAFGVPWQDDGSGRNSRDVWSIGDDLNVWQYLYDRADDEFERGRIFAAYEEWLSFQEQKQDIWTTTTAKYRGAHFAVFPEALIEPCILAGSSPRACEMCGSPWRREMEIESLRERADAAGTWAERPKAQGYAEAAGSSQGIDPTSGLSASNSHDESRSPTSAKRRTVGWLPTCKCVDAHRFGNARCRVLDPFAGSGTTIIKAEKLGRDAVGSELNPAYAALIEERYRIAFPATDQNQAELELA